MTATTPFSLTVPARWDDMDFNAHMANTAYPDLGAEACLACFETQGFSASEFQRHGIGPFVQEDVLTYFAEIRLREAVRVTLKLAGLSAADTPFRFRSLFHPADAKLAACLTSTGGGLDLARRRLTAIPDALRLALENLSRNEDFAVPPPKSRP